MSNYDNVKVFEDQKYSGMHVGGSHTWAYNNGLWNETKLTPTEWKIRFECVKNRTHIAPTGSGPPPGTRYHWMIIADQKVTKLDANSYQTVLEGTKYKMGHKRPYWRAFSYDYPEQASYRQRLINILKDYLLRLEEAERDEQQVQRIPINISGC